MNKIAVERILLLAIWVGIMLVLLIPLIVTRDFLFGFFTATIFPFIVGKSVLSHLAIELMLAAWLILARQNPSYRPPKSWLLTIFAVFLFISFLAGVFGVSFQRSLWSTYERMQGVVDLAHWFAFTVILASVLRSFTFWRILLTANLGVSLVVALLAVAQRYDLQRIYQLLPYYDFLTLNSRPGSTLGNPSFLAAYLMVNVFIALALFGYSLSTRSERNPPSPAEIRRRRRRRSRTSGSQFDWSPVKVYSLRAFLTFSVVFNFWVMTITGTRGAITGLMLGLFLASVIYAIYGRINVVRASAVVTTTLLVIVVIVFFAGRDTTFVQRFGASNVMVQRLAALGLSDVSVRSRIQTFPVAIRGFSERPILGWGPENYLIPFGRYYVAGTGSTLETFDQAHNKLLEELATKGSLGFVSYLALWVALLWIIVRAVRRQEANLQLFTLIIGAALVGYFVQNLFLFDTPATVMQLMVLVGLVAYIENSTRWDDPDKNDGGNGAVGARRLAGDVPPPGRFASSVTNIRKGADRILNRLRGPVRKYQELLSWPYAPVIGLGVALALVGSSVYFTSVKPYQAASKFLKVSEPTDGFEEALAHFDESIQAFTPLANYPRIVLFQSLAENWDQLGPAERRIALLAVEAEAVEALDSESQNWRIYLALAEFYLHASSEDSENMAIALTYLEKSVELAPQRPETTELLEKFAR